VTTFVGTPVQYGHGATKRRAPAKRVVSVSSSTECTSETTRLSTASVGSGGAWRYYRLRLTADASNITLVLTKTAGVPGLYVGLGGRPPTRSSYLKVAQAGALTLSGTEVGVPTTLEVGVFSWEEARYSLLAIVEAAPSAAAAAADGACDADKDGVYDKAECDEAAAPAASDAPPPFLPPGALDPTPPARPFPRGALPRPVAVAAAAAARQDAYVKYSRSCRWRCTALKWPPPESDDEIDECVSQLSSSSLKFDM